MKSVEALLQALERLVSSLPPNLGAEVSRLEGDEPFRRVLFLSQHGAADLSLWARAHVGGLVDLEVIDEDDTQRFWRHLEGPTVAELEEAWIQMLAAYEQLLQ